MKTAKQAPNTRRSLRNIANDSKITKRKSTKLLSTKGKRIVDDKPRKSKTPLKNDTQLPKKKRIADVEPPGTPPPPEDSIPETQNKPNSETDKPKLEKSAKPRVKRTKKVKELQPQISDHGWRTLDELGDGVLSSDEGKKKTVSSQKGDRRKQSLVERDIPCTVLVKTLPVAVPLRTEGNDSDCEMIDGQMGVTRQGNDVQQNAETIDVDLDEVHSEAGSNFCEIIDEPDSGFDYKKLYIQANRVALPSSLWACHVDPRKEFVSFTRFNPDFPTNSSNIVDRAVIFKGSIKPDVFCNCENTTLPEEINNIETLTHISQVLQHLNSMNLP